MKSQQAAVGRYLFWTAGVSVLIAVATPKIMIGETPVYASELVLALAPVLLFIGRPTAGRLIHISTAAALVLTFYAFVLLGSAWTATVTAEYSVTSFLLLGKRFLYHFAILVLAENGVRLLAERSGTHVDFLFRSLLIMGLLPLLFSMAELAAFAALGLQVPMRNVTGFADSYAPTLFAVGFTGRAIGPEGFYLVGSSSINYGILNAGLSLLALLYHDYTRRRRWLALSLLYAAGVVLTLSSTALIVLAAGVMTHITLRGNRPLRAVSVVLVATLLMLFAAMMPVDRERFYALGDLVQTFQGVLYGTEEASNVDLRMETFNRAFAGLDRHPHVIWTGAGINEYTAQIMNSDDPLIESFVLDALLNAGIVGFSALILSFVFLGEAVGNATRLDGMSGLAADFIVRFAPGLLFSNTISGNSVQSEFVGSLLFVVLAICAGAASRPSAAAERQFAQ